MTAAVPGAFAAAFEVLLPPDVDLLLLNTAPLELTGRIALHGQSRRSRHPARAVIGGGSSATG